MDRLYSKIKKDSNNCWNFTGALRNGYGAIKYNGKIWGTHRLSYFLTNGFDNDHLLVCHRCDNPKCINPEHLFLGTYSDNTKDCKNKGRLVVPINIERRFKKGDYPNNTKIPLNEALIIKQKILNRGKISLIEISKKLKIPYQYARDISCGRILKNR